jgi:recombination associated protein RdgC
MGFLAGRVTCMRFRVGGRALRTFGPEHLDALADHAIGKQRVASGDGSQVGWIAADHILDTSFDLAKNVVNDAMQVAMRVDEVKMPGDLLRAYYQVELQALAATNPSGHPSGKQKRQAREYAKDRLETEAKDGRYLRRKAIPVLWDAPSSELLVGTTSVAALDRLVTLFHQTFERKFELLGAGRQAFNLAELTDQTRGVDDAKPTAFAPGGQVTEFAWMPDENNRDFLGNEFLLWLWHYVEQESDTIKLSDNSEVVLMIARTLQLECPRGQTGSESISSDGPTKLPEALRAIQAGKVPRKMGLTLVRQDSQYELTLQAESLAISGAKLPAPEGEEERARLEERITQIRHLLETLDLIYAAFIARRLGDAWAKEASQIKKWLHL